MDEYFDFKHPSTKKKSKLGSKGYTNGIGERV